MATAVIPWSDRIKIISDRFKNAQVELRDPSRVVTVYDPLTATMVQSGDPVVWSGRARIQPVRLAVDTRGGASTGNPSAEVRVRVQIDRDAITERIERGWIVKVTASEYNAQLLDYQLVVDAAVDSSWRASITVECTVDPEQVAG